MFATSADCVPLPSIATTVSEVVALCPEIAGITERLLQGELRSLLIEEMAWIMRMAQLL